jgi:chromate transporter
VPLAFPVRAKPYGRGGGAALNEIMNSPSPDSGSPQTPQTSPAPQIRPSLAELFLAFATISLSGFGGVLAWSRRMMVDERHWLTPEQFNEAYALCAFLPGPNIVNFSVIFGSRFRGPLGGLTALAGLLGPPMILIIIIGAIYAHYGDLPVLRRMLTGVASAAAGLLIATVAKMARPLFRNRAVAGPLVAIATFAAIGVMQWPLPLVLAFILPVSIAAAWVRL